MNHSLRIAVNVLLALAGVVALLGFGYAWDKMGSYPVDGVSGRNITTYWGLLLGSFAVAAGATVWLIVRMVRARRDKPAH